MNENGNDALGYNRRDFLKSGSFATLMTMMGGVELFAQPTEQPASDSKGSGAKIKVAVIGLGSWGREILTELTKLEGADVAAICDTYGAFLRRSGKMAPGARQIQDCKAILEDKDIRAVVVATPTHKHKDIVLAALKAGKHVYCEAPLAGSIEDAREIALAARAAKKQIFQAGLQMRADPQRQFLLPFIRTGALGKTVMARSGAGEGPELAFEQSHFHWVDRRNRNPPNRSSRVVSQCASGFRHRLWLTAKLDGWARRSGYRASNIRIPPGGAILL